MAFLPEDFHDLVVLLEQRPEWRAELRRLVLSEELLSLPALVRELAEAQRRAEARLEGVEDRLARAEARLEGVEDRLARAEELLAQLIEVQRHAERRLGRLETQVGDLQGHDLERRYRERAHAYLGQMLRRIHVLTPDELATLVEDALDEGRLSARERQALFDADLIARGRRPDDEREVFVVGEVSVGVGVTDVRRAAERASILSKLRPSLALVGGRSITPDAQVLASRLGVWQVVDGRVVAPARAQA